MIKRLLLLITATVCLGCESAQDMSGTWKLDVDKSDWHGVRRPLGVVVTVEHQEPRLAYTGHVIYQDSPARGFDFNRAIDGKPYPSLRSYGAGSSKVRRLGRYLVESEFRSSDGNFREAALTIVSADGKHMTRSLRLNGPNGGEDWTEVYNKQ